jgi:uncharacterized protein (UPF0335 family)
MPAPSDEERDEKLEQLARKVESVKVDDEDIKRSLKEIAAELRGTAVAAREEPRKPPRWLRE